MLRFYFLHSHRVVPTSTHRVVAGISTLPVSCELGFSAPSSKQKRGKGTREMSSQSLHTRQHVHPPRQRRRRDNVIGFPYDGRAQSSGVEHTRRVKRIYGRPANIENDDTTRPHKLGQHAARQRDKFCVQIHSPRQYRHEIIKLSDLIGLTHT